MSKNPNMKRIFSKETRKKLSIAATGRKHTKETKLKLSILRKGKPSHRKGKKLPLKTKIKMSENQKGKGNNNWKGGKSKDGKGYIKIYYPEHPNSDSHGYVKEHRLVIEKKIKRFLKTTEVIHHIDEIKSNNNIDNLVLCSNDLEHRKLHKRGG